MRNRYRALVASLWTAAFVAVATVGAAPHIDPAPSQAEVEGSEAADGLRVPAPWPCRILTAGHLYTAAERAWNHSATFRHQCLKLAAAKAIIVMTTAPGLWQAESRIGTTPDGVTVARVRGSPGGNTVELIAHEVEHVLERVDGVNYLLEALRGGSTVSQSGGAFETRRARDAGRRVAREVEKSTRASARPKR